MFRQRFLPKIKAGPGRLPTKSKYPPTSWPPIVFIGTDIIYAAEPKSKVRAKIHRICGTAQSGGLFS